MSQKKKKASGFVIFLLIVAILQVVAIVYLKYNYQLASRESDNDKELPISLTITEICCDNFNILADEMGETPGYIELYNNSDRVVNLSSYYITNGDVSFRLPKRTLDPGQYRLVYASSFVPVIDENGNVSTAKGVFCGFSVSAGDTLALSDGESIVHQITVGEITENQSFSYIVDHFEKSRPTPLEASLSADSLVGIPESPEFSLPGGFYTSNEEVEISAAGAKIYYTLDASAPTEASIPYTSPISILRGENTVIRAIAVTESGKVSEIATATYFAKNFEGEKVLSLVTDTAAEEGATGHMAEVPVSLEYFNDGASVFSENCGVRISQNSLGNDEYVFYQRTMYNGHMKFDYSVFDTEEPIHSFTLKEEGEEEAALQPFLKEAGLLSKQTTEAKLYVNGEYKMTVTLLENYDSTYLENYCGISEEELVLLSEESESVKENKEYTDLLSFVENHDMSDPDNYASFSEAVDTESFIRYMATNLYLGNLDISQTENVLVFRTDRFIESGYKNGKWHWLPGEVTVDCLYSENTLAYVAQSAYGESRVNYPVLTSLLKNEDFKKDFVSVYCSLMNATFDATHAEALLEESGIYNSSLGAFFALRPTYAITHLTEALDITESLCSVTICCTEADFEITLDGVPLSFEGNIWTGKFAADSRVCFEAIAADGRKFQKWSGDLETRHSTLIMDVEGDIVLTANFKDR